MQHIPRILTRRTAERVHTDWAETLAYVQQGGNIKITCADGVEIGRLLAPYKWEQAKHSPSVRVDLDEQVTALLALRTADGRPVTADRGGRRVELLDLEALREPQPDGAPVWYGPDPDPETGAVAEAGHILWVDHPQERREYTVDWDDPVLLAMIDGVLDTIPEDQDFYDVATAPWFEAATRVIGTYMVATSNGGLHESSANPPASARSAIRRARLRAVVQAARS